jgi:hypothetical protein
MTLRLYGLGSDELGAGAVGALGWVGLGWVDGTRFAFRSYGCFFGRLNGLFLRLDLAVAGRRAEGWSGIAAGDRAAWRGAQRP